MASYKTYYYVVKCTFISAMVFGLLACSDQGNDQSIVESDFVLDTVCSIEIFGSKKKELLTHSFSMLNDVQQKMDVYKEGTEANAINDNAGIKPISVSNDTYLVIEKGKHFSKESGGLFDITIGPLVKLWNIGSGDATIPSEERIGRTLNLIDYKRLILDKKHTTVYLQKKGMRLDLGGIAKGYAADQVAAYLISKGIDSAILNFGGNVFALGERERNKYWRIGIQDPHDERNTYVGIVKVKNKAVVTSGKYERYFMKNEVKYHHILSTQDGYPVRNGIESVTIITKNSLEADAISTLVFVLGLENGFVYAENRKATEAVIIMKTKDVYITSGLENTFTITDQDYALKTEP